MKDDLKLKHKMKLDTKWSNTVITPGTVFMERLHQHLSAYFQNKAKTDRCKRKYTYSSYHTSGEGEHKIMKDIRRRLRQAATLRGVSIADDLYVVYGLDADL